MSTNPAEPGSRNSESGNSRTNRSSRGRVKFVVPLIVVALLAGWWVSSGDTADRKDAEHVVLIVVDTTRRDSFGCYGSSRPTTPNMDAIAAEGVRFDQVIAQSCWTLPTITSILTSTYPTIHGATGKLEIPNESVVFHRSRDAITHAPEVLSEQGIKTHAIVNVGFLSPKLGIDRGFDEYDFVPGTNLRIRRADASVDAAIEFLRENRQKNTFLFLHLFDPHLNYDPPGEFKRLYNKGYKGPYLTLTPMQTRDLVMGHVVPAEAEQGFLRAKYDAEITFMDREIGRLVSFLREMGMYDRTTIIIVADHGEEFWDHNRFEHGHSMYQELIHLPLIIKLPGRIARARQVVPTRVRQIDIMPTILDLLDIDCPDTFEGESLLGLMTDGAEFPDRPAYSEGTLYGADKVAMYEGNYKYVLDLADNTAELYDVRTDPLETNNLAHSIPQAAGELRNRLEVFRSSLQARDAELPPPETIDLTAGRNEELLKQLEALGYVKREQ